MRTVTATDNVCRKNASTGNRNKEAKRSPQQHHALSPFKTLHPISKPILAKRFLIKLKETINQLVFRYDLT